MYNSQKSNSRPKTENRQMPVDCDTLHKMMVDRELIGEINNDIRPILAHIFYNTDKTLHQVFAEY